MTEILYFCDLRHSGSNHKTLKRYLDFCQIDYSHIPTGRDSAKQRAKLGAVPKNKIPIEKILNNEVPYKSSNLRRRLISDGYMENKCVECGLGEERNSKSIVLQLDHIDGNPQNNNLSNLRILCPNCHSQTDNFAGRCKKLKSKLEKELHMKMVVETATQRFAQLRKDGKIPSTPRKFNISKEELEKLLWKMPSTEIAKMFNVSSVAIAKRAKSFGLSKPARGYWAKLKATNKTEK